MPVEVRSAPLRNRLLRLQRALPQIAAASVLEAANSMRTQIQNAIRSDWVSNNQVGFDLENFLNIIGEVEPIAGGGVGILNVEKMGTYQDLERIAHIKGLYHQKTRQGDKFGLFINQLGAFFDHVAELADARSAMWRGKEPQWWLIEHGTIGVTGTYNPQPPKNTITVTSVTAQPAMWRAVETAVDRMFKVRGVTV